MSTHRIVPIPIFGMNFLFLLCACIALVGLTLGTGMAKASALIRPANAAGAASSAQAGRKEHVSQTCGIWNIVSSPNPSASFNRLISVAAVSASDVWAVGSYYTVSGNEQTLTEHWNGSQWSVVSSPNSSAKINVLNGVTAISSNDVWAVGFYFDSSIPNQTLIEHWDGSQWSIVKSPSPPLSSSFLNGVAARAADDIWAVGGYVINGSQTLVEHWNGSQWSIVSSPNASIDDVLSAVSVTSASNIWAVGYYTILRGHPVRQTLTEHWNGMAWSVVSSPNPGSSDNVLTGTAAISSGNAWASGFSVDAATNNVYTLTEHWNGTAWSVVSSPNPSTSDNFLFGIAAASADNIWTVGDYIHNGTVRQPLQTLTQHWNGTAWSVVSSPNPPGAIGSELNAVAHVAGTSQFWVVGDFSNTSSGEEQTLTEFYC